jgi:hypothetical protein
MDGQRFDRIGKWLATNDGRCTTRRGLVAGALAIGLGRLSAEDAAAKCKKDGQKCKKNNDCCSHKCKGGKCKCRSLQEPCTGTTGSAGNTCCGSLFCSPTSCSAGNKRCCRGVGLSCGSTCDCCGTGTQCLNGTCCLKEGENCLFVGSEGCCSGLFCSLAQGSTCQPIKLPDL